jgi:hypothetical protein
MHGLGLWLELDGLLKRIRTSSQKNDLKQNNKISNFYMPFFFFKTVKLFNFTK